MFTINRNTKIAELGFERSRPALDAIGRLCRDISWTTSENPQADGGLIQIEKDEQLPAEAWTIDAREGLMTIRAADDLAAAYALAHVSEKALGVKPLWFWAGQEFDEAPGRTYPLGHFSSEPSAFRFRGWFINDEVLIAAWRPGGKPELPWAMAFEALVRLGGNCVIPGTDRNSLCYEELAASYGLWITHHHSQPLGAEMFARAFPGEPWGFAGARGKYEKLWREGVERQKGNKTIWTLGFRGQGDYPFWKDAEGGCSTPGERGALLSEILEIQAGIVREKVENPVFCFNIYQEAVELYRGGHLKLPGGTIRIWADNGYGAMVSRRQGDDNPRNPALPDPGDAGPHGMYYHASFYDLQAASHLVQMGTPMEVLAGELNKARDAGVDDTLILNVSNIKPHLAAIAFAADYWRTGTADAARSLPKFSEDYLEGFDATRFHLEWGHAAPKYGPHPDDRGGEQYLTYPVRMFMTSWLKGEDPCPDFAFACGGSFRDQVAKYKADAEECGRRMGALAKEIEEASRSAPKEARALVEEQVLLQARLMERLSFSAVKASEMFLALKDGDYLKAFLLCGDAARACAGADELLRTSGRPRFEGFYGNEALADISFLATQLKAFMETIRALGEGPGFNEWHRELLYKEEDRRVVLLTNWEKRLPAYEMYLEYRKREAALN